MVGENHFRQPGAEKKSRVADLRHAVRNENFRQVSASTERPDPDFNRGKGDLIRGNRLTRGIADQGFPVPCKEDPVLRNGKGRAVGRQLKRGQAFTVRKGIVSDTGNPGRKADALQFRTAFKGGRADLRQAVRQIDFREAFALAEGVFADAGDAVLYQDLADRCLFRGPGFFCFWQVVHCACPGDDQKSIFI